MSVACCGRERGIRSGACRAKPSFSLFAIPAAGLVKVTINTHLSASEVEYIVEHSKSKMVFVDTELEDLLEGVDESVERVRIDDTGEEGDPYEDYLAEGSA
ncbi:MAG: hypothetical protein QOI57_794 [Rubrobacteraceae bacterium]|nr:hypothetical protein [Rubrobacteraceae bacterium]